MYFDIKNDLPVAALEKAFNEAFGQLRLGFFSQPHRLHEKTSFEFLITDNFRTFGEIRDAAHQNEGRVFVDPEMPVWQIERLFEDDFGLHVQILRKAGDQWLQTSVTDDETLEELTDDQPIFINQASQSF